VVAVRSWTRSVERSAEMPSDGGSVRPGPPRDGVNGAYEKRLEKAP
jgi:hypothetical protein